MNKVERNEMYNAIYSVWKIEGSQNGGFYKWLRTLIPPPTPEMILDFGTHFPDSKYLPRKQETIKKYWREFFSGISKYDDRFTETMISYLEYLRHPHWKEFKNYALKERNFQCQECKSVKNLEVNHLNYECLWFESLEDVSVLCADCHEKWHKNNPNIRSKAYICVPKSEHCKLGHIYNRENGVSDNGEISDGIFPDVLPFDNKAETKHVESNKPRKFSEQYRTPLFIGDDGRITVDFDENYNSKMGTLEDVYDLMDKMFPQNNNGSPI